MMTGGSPLPIIQPTGRTIQGVNPTSGSWISARIQHSRPLPADAYRCQPDSSGVAPGMLGTIRLWENLQVTGQFSRVGARSATIH